MMRGDTGDEDRSGRVRGNKRRQEADIRLNKII